MRYGLLSVVMCIVACNGDDKGAGTSGEGGAGGTSDAGESSSPSSSGSVGSAGDSPPTESAALFAWLGSGAYETWRAESAVHPSAGPHGGDVRTFVNDALFESLASDASSHPVGSAAVKELHAAGAVRGWAVGVKTSPDSAGGDGWYWYENFSVSDSSNPVAAGLGVGLCSGCHAGGLDYVLTPFPLQ